MTDDLHAGTGIAEGGASNHAQETLAGLQHSNSLQDLNAADRHHDAE